MEHVEPAESAGGSTEQPTPPPGAEEVAQPGQIPADDGTVGTGQPSTVSADLKAAGLKLDESEEQS